MYTKILVFGTFDGIHLGHENFFRQARSLAKNPFLIISVARDRNVGRVKNKKPIHAERSRLALVSRHVLADNAVLGAVDDYIAHIAKLKPAIIALGYDQRAYTEHLKEKLEHCGLSPIIKRLRPFKPHKYKTSLLGGRGITILSKSKMPSNR